MKLNRLFGVCLLASVAACGGDEAQEGGIVSSDPITERINVSAALKNILEQSASYQVSLTEASGAVTRVDLRISPEEDTEVNGLPVKVSKTVNQTTASNGFVTESTTTTLWDTDPDNQDRVRVRQVTAVTPTGTVVTTVQGNAQLPDPVLVDTNGSYYDGAVNQGNVRLGLVEVRWAIEPNNAETAWVCSVGTATYNEITSKECYLVNPAGELQGSYRSVLSDANVTLVFQ
jgi:hypothetical protein